MITGEKIYLLEGSANIHGGALRQHSERRHLGCTPYPCSHTLSALVRQYKRWTVDARVVLALFHQV